MLCLQQLVHHLLELPPVHLLDGGTETVHIPLHDAGQQIPLHLVVGHLNALDGGELSTDQLPQIPLHLRIALVAQLGGEAHHRGLADLHRLSQPAGGHKGRLVIVLQNVGGNALLSLGKLWHLLANGMQHVVIQPHRFPSSLVIPHLLSISTCQMEGSPNAGYAPAPAAAAARKAPPDGTSGGSAGSCPDG